ncbi:PREDICTED: growth-regulating factor 8 [Ipomoea nil]|uniref:growth-regulating factor 8 n=1 Tax=Ipomoea nil TaxID=35883 RepID=UPI000901262E|nr:PREDICTED: growth-regulating factor 8 [Ipomoea nil]
MGSRERSGKLAGLGEHDDDSSSYRCTKKTTRLNRQFQFSPSETEGSCFGDGGNGTSAAPAGGPIFFNSAAPLTGGSMGSEKAVVFTASQRQEFERQSLIYKYMMASVPVPPQLLIPLPKTQSNKSGLDLKFPAGSDPEPWRCRRTDGKKWRCSRDVLPDQKYCERHAHKNRPRSRKPVEIQSHKNSPNHNNNYPVTVPSFQFPATASCDQNRSNEWFARQKQQFVLSPPPSTLGYTIGNAINMNTSSLYRPELSSNEQGFVNPNLFLEGHEARSHQVNSAFLSHNMAFLQANAGIVHPTQHFIDGLDNTDHNSLSCKSSDRKLPFCSFRLSVPGGGEDNHHQGLSVGMLNPESQSSSSIMPGGPLGEALCLGTASNLPSPHGYSNSSGTSSCSLI